MQVIHYKILRDDEVVSTIKVIKQIEPEPLLLYIDAFVQVKPYILKDSHFELNEFVDECSDLYSAELIYLFGELQVLNVHQQVKFLEKVFKPLSCFNLLLFVNAKQLSSQLEFVLQLLQLIIPNC